MATRFVCILFVHVHDESHVYFGCSPTLTVPVLELNYPKIGGHPCMTR